MSKSFNAAEVQKLREIVNEGIRIKSETDILTEGLREAVKAIAKEMDIKPAILTKAINVAYKSELGKHRDDFDDLETILTAVGRDL